MIFLGISHSRWIENGRKQIINNNRTDKHTNGSIKRPFFYVFFGILAINCLFFSLIRFVLKSIFLLLFKLTTDLHNVVVASKWQLWFIFLGRISSFFKKGSFCINMPLLFGCSRSRQWKSFYWPWPVFFSSILSSSLAHCRCCYCSHLFHFATLLLFVVLLNFLFLFRRNFMKIKSPIAYISWLNKQFYRIIEWVSVCSLFIILTFYSHCLHSCTFKMIQTSQSTL